MGAQSNESVLDEFSQRSLARIVYIAAFLGVETLTDLFETFPPLFWLGVVGLVLVFFDAVICARRRWRVVKSELRGENETEPDC